MAAAVIEGFVFGGEIVCDGIARRKPTAHFFDAGAAFCSGLISSTYPFRSWHLFFVRRICHTSSILVIQPKFSFFFAYVGSFSLRKTGVSFL